MRVALVVVVSTLVLAATATAAQVAPRSLVLRTSEVPTGFVLDREHTGIRSNEREAGSNEKDRALIAKMRRITGYERDWDRRDDSISARVDLFHAPAGARMLLSMYATEMRRSGIKGLLTSSVRLGDRGWMWHGGPSSEFNIVAWRTGRVFGQVVGLGITRDRTLALARVQQRRIATVLG